MNITFWTAKYRNEQGAIAHGSVSQDKAHGLVGATLAYVNPAIPSMTLAPEYIGDFWGDANLRETMQRARNAVKQAAKRRGLVLISEAFTQYAPKK